MDECIVCLSSYVKQQYWVVQHFTPLSLVTPGRSSFNNLKLVPSRIKYVHQLIYASEKTELRQQNFEIAELSDMNKWFKI